jgi:Tfp pilus assembly protein PilF
MKTMIRIAGVLFVVACAVPSASAKQADSKYASDEEINLLMGQADRAMKQYEQIIGEEKRLLGGGVDTSTDAQLLRAWKTVKGALDKDPQKYNSFAGFDIVTMLDDAARNAALVSNSAAATYLRFLHWQGDTFSEAVTELTKCSQMVKKPK